VPLNCWLKPASVHQMKIVEAQRAEAEKLDKKAKSGLTSVDRSMMYYRTGEFGQKQWR
jgi:hypothetical protein